MPLCLRLKRLFHVARGRPSEHRFVGVERVLDLAIEISANHGHIAIVEAARLTSPTAITVDIRGNATHRHLIELTSSQLAMISNNGRVSVVSSTDESHNHTVTSN